MNDESKTTKDILATLPVELEEALREEAKQNHRSRNKQLISILEERYAKPLQATPQTTAQSWQAFT